MPQATPQIGEPHLKYLGRNIDKVVLGVTCSLTPGTIRHIPKTSFLAQAQNFLMKREMGQW